MSLLIKNLIILLLIAIFVFSCSEDEILPEEEFIKVYVDILIARDTTTDKSITPDSIKAIVLNKHNVPDSVYIKTIEHYNSSSEKWEEFFNNAIKHVEELQAKEEE